MESYNVWLFVSVFIHNVAWFIHVVACPSTSFLFIVWIYTTFHFSICQLINILVVSTFWPLWIILLWAFMYKSLCRHGFHSFGYIAKSKVTRSCGSSVWLFEEMPNLSVVASSFYIPTSLVCEFWFVYILFHSFLKVELYSVVCQYQFIFNHSPIDGHKDC